MKKCSLFLALIVVCSSAVAQTTPQQAVRQFREANGAEILQEYQELLKIPNVASDIENIRRNADWIMDAFEQRGVEMELLELPNSPDVSPIIYGNLEAPDAERTHCLCPLRRPARRSHTVDA